MAARALSVLMSSFMIAPPFLSVGTASELGKSCVRSFFDSLRYPQQLIVFGDPVHPCRGPRLDLTGSCGHRQITYERIVRFAGPVGYDGRVSVTACQSDDFQRFGKGSDLVQFDKDRVGSALLDASRQLLRVRDEEIVPYDLYGLPQFFR